MNVGDPGRTLCHAWKIRPDGDFEAETNSGTILFRRDDIHLIESHESENNLHAWVCVGNFQRMVWIDFPGEAEARQFVIQMEQNLNYKRF